MGKMCYNESKMDNKVYNLNSSTFSAINDDRMECFQCLAMA